MKSKKNNFNEILSETFPSPGIMNFQVMKPKMETIITDILQWSTNRGLDKNNPDKQMLKLMEEVGELAQGMAKQRPGQVRDSIGDILVVLIILCQQLNLDITEVLEGAYHVIAERKGKTIDGVFIKNTDKSDIGSQDNERDDEIDILN